VCEVASNSCHELPTVEDAFDDSCSKPCDGLLVLSDPASMTGDTCCDLACKCVSQPPVVPTRIGRYARIVHTGGAVLVSAYDAEFGDLVGVGLAPGLQLRSAPGASALALAIDSPTGGLPSGLTPEAALVAGAAAVALNPLWHLAAFLVMVAFYWSTFRTQVPLFLSNQAAIEALAGVLPGDRAVRLLDVGCGSARLLADRAGHVRRVAGLDVSELGGRC
jgi:hypothetical protein